MKKKKKKMEDDDGRFKEAAGESALYWRRWRRILDRRERGVRSGSSSYGAIEA
jgi:hypothetical protein